MRTTYFPALTITGLMLLTACSSTSRAAPVTTTATTIEQPSTTAAPVPTTATTVAPATTTTEAPPPTTPPDVTAAIKQAVLDYDAARFACWQEVATCDPTTYTRGAHLESERKQVAIGVARSALVRHRQEDPAYWVFESVEVSPTDRAIVTGCHWDTDILERLGGGVINAVNFSNHDTVELTLEDGTWWVTRLTINRQAEGIDECGGRP
jgi:hypothetical protein